MQQCLGYVRVSTQKQGEGVSLEAQKEAILGFAERNNLTISKWFEEKQTAAKRGRPVFNQMIAALKRGRADGVVMHKIDRSARNFADWAKIGDLSDAGIDVYFVTETLDFRSRGGRLAADIQAVVAADYIRNLRDEARKGIEGRLKQGLYPFKAPLGYLDQGGGQPKIPDPVRASLVKRAFDLYGSGQHSIRSLVIEMERLGLRNEQGKPMSKCAIENMLQNPFYYGIIRIKRTGAVYQGVHEPLISSNLYSQVQNIKAGKRVKKVTRHRFTYRRLFRCAHCQAAMTPERQKGHVYYRCQTPGCATKCVREEQVEAAVSAMLSKVALSDEHKAEITRSVECWSQERNDTDSTQTYAMQLEKSQQRLERLEDAVIDQLIDKDTYHRRRKKLLLEHTKLQELHAEHQNRQLKPGLVVQFLELIKNLSEHYKIAKPDEKREIVEIATSNRTVVGKNIYIEPAKWLATAQTAIGVLCGPPYRTTSRTRTKLRNQQIEALADLTSSGMVEKIEGVFIDDNEPNKVIR
ncbi:recombinase family protein [Hoeflea poritis]|uniref:Recombinase family protein n=1 Tax=Hoeflea poritis TaxID=2993659 RepID=A0ABT4VKK5_9HYPH|nr:recombinase family protein [Hoeflea poritis]MDA4845247.1 recombinase family protein [Hoeflea poritis]